MVLRWCLGPVGTCDAGEGKWNGMAKASGIGENVSFIINIMTRNKNKFLGENLFPWGLWDKLNECDREEWELRDGEGLGLFRQMTIPEQKRAHAFGP